MRVALPPVRPGARGGEAAAGEAGAAQEAAAEGAGAAHEAAAQEAGAAHEAAAQEAGAAHEAAAQEAGAAQHASTSEPSAEVPSGRLPPGRWGERFSTAVLLCTRAMPSAALAPHRAHDGAVPADALALHARLLASSAVQSSALLGELLIGLGRTHRAQSARRLHCRADSADGSAGSAEASSLHASSLHAPAVLRAAAQHSVTLSEALHRCRDGALRGVSLSLAHLWPTIDALLAAHAPAPRQLPALGASLASTSTDNESTDACLTDTLELAASPAASRVLPAEEQATSARKRKHAEVIG